MIERLLDFRTWSFWESTGLWAHFLSEPAPFPVSQSPESVPNVGYLSLGTMKQLLIEDTTNAPGADGESQSIRAELLEVIESLVEDEMEMVAIAFD